MKRVIFLVDMNAFFISCETTINPGLKGKPAAVAGDPTRRSGIILAANYEARAFGVKTTMVLYEARRLCPDIIFIPPTRNLYETKSKAVMEILRRYTPVIEQNSIDEAWMDLTGCLKLFGQPMEIARKIMSDIQNELDLWCSIGISENKFLAKMASEMKKPLGITELWTEDIENKLWPLQIRNMYGIGKQTEKKLLMLGIEKIGDLAGFDRRLLASRFGKYGEELYRLANGIDYSPVSGHNESEVKSISRSTTLPQDITDIEAAGKVLLKLAEEVGAEARSLNKKGRTVHITIKYGDFNSITRQNTVPPTYLTKEIYNTGLCLLRKNWNSSRPVRLLGIGLSEFDKYDDIEQISMFDLPGDCKKSDKEERLEKTIDAIRQRFGEDKVNRAIFIKNAERKRK